VNWLRFRWANDVEPVLRSVLTVTPGVQYFVKALTKKISAALMVSSHDQKLSLHFADRHFESSPEQWTHRVAKRYRDGATTYKDPEWARSLMGLPSPIF
jgi:hypothetical protein